MVDTSHFMGAAGLSQHAYLVRKDVSIEARRSEAQTRAGLI